ncbi:MAG TPA: ribbon-helix-helix domain-containing protein [Stellaceae bacterium]|jgi:predicted DNA-binding ribbon-helix-helix protein|nr:ribbon-helix-helix domain-containing protein [Stellaceae bacterium]
MASDGELLSETREIAAAADAPPALALPWEQRILQLDGKRYSLRLGQEFWAALEAIATRRKRRLNRLVAEIASHRPSDTNLSSQLRVFCLGEMERATAGRSMALDRASVTALVEAAPMPGLLLDANQIVLAANEAFQHWSGIKRALLLRQNLAAWFRLQCASCFEGLWSRPIREEETRIVGLIPGRVLAADARLVPVLNARGPRLCVVWVAS